MQAYAFSYSESFRIFDKMLEFGSYLINFN